MAIDFRFYKAKPEPEALVQFPIFDQGTEPLFTVIALHRDADPDSSTHDGYDYFGAYGKGADIDVWASYQPMTAISKGQLPQHVDFYPAPFPAA